MTLIGEIGKEHAVNPTPGFESAERITLRNHNSTEMKNHTNLISPCNSES